MMFGRILKVFLDRFSRNGANELASADSQGRIIIWRLTFVGADEDINIEVLLNLHLEGISTSLRI